MSQSGWEGILDADETLIWQGRPDGGFSFKMANIFATIFSLFFAGFAVFWMMTAYEGGAGFWMFGLIHFSAGVGMFVNQIFGDTYRRRRMWYSLSNKRAFIATQPMILGRKLKSYPITSTTQLELSTGALTDIIFASKIRYNNKRRYETDIGFRRLDDGSKVYALMRQIQQGEL